MSHRQYPLMALVVTTMAWVSGCTVGPDYTRPVVDSPDSFRFATSQTEASLADLPWWEVYTDQTLQQLIRTALDNNYDVRIAVTRVEQARAIAAQARSQFYPSVGYAGGISGGRNEFQGTPTPNGGDDGGSALAILNAAWELDLWGRIRRLNESARAELLATEYAKRGVMLTLVSDVAQAYLELLELDLELQIADETTQSFQESLRIFQDRLGQGVASKLETSRAEGALANTAARIPLLQREIAIVENRLRVLLGQNPAPVERDITLLEVPMPTEIPAGLPSALLERRPDILAAEQALVSANAQVGVAHANFFPQIGLTAMFGKVSPELSAFSSGSSNAWSIAANLTGPIFQGGQLKAELAQSKAFWEQTALEYQLTALNAFQEVSNVLISSEKFREADVQLQRTVAAYQESVKVSMQRYMAGKAGYFEVLEAQQDLFPAENELALNRLNQNLVIVNLYRALGGGWQIPDSEWNPAPAPPP